jgi:TP901-1 family phage major tail protein
MINGSDILLFVNTGTPELPSYEAVGSQRDVTFEENTEEIDVSSKDQREMRVIAGRYSANISLDALYVPDDAAFTALQDAMRNGTLILVQRQEAGVALEEADALITSMSSSFPDQGEGTISISLTIDGAWTPSA